MKSIDEIKADYHLFIEIQMGKYFRSINKSEFSDEAEAKFVLDKIINAYNQKIASEHLKLDNLNPAAKTAWFNSIEIDFTDKSADEMNSEEFAGSDYGPGILSDIFPGISDKELDLVPFCWVVLQPLNYKAERFSEIIAGSEPLEIEIELLQWAYKITSLVNKAIYTKSGTKAEVLMDKAYYLACEKVKKKEAKDIILNLQRVLRKEMDKNKKKRE